MNYLVLCGAMETLRRLLLRDEDQAIVDQLTKEKSLSDCTLDDFAAINAPLLKSFIVARHPTATVKSRLPNKGKIEFARAMLDMPEEHREETLILMAYNVRTLRSRALCAPTDDETSTEEEAEEVEEQWKVHRVEINLKENLYPVAPSVLLGKSAWVELVCRIFDKDEQLNRASVTEALMANANQVWEHLKSRLHNHLCRVKESQHRHWSLMWARKNLAVVAAYMVLFKHAKDVSCANEHSCLIILPSRSCNYLRPTNNNANWHGAYLHADENEDKLIRCGMTTHTDGFIGRNHEHEKRAKADRNDDNCLFYNAYPSKESRRAACRARDGYWESLVQYVAAGFDRSDDAIAAFQQDESVGGLFFMNEEEQQRIRALKLRGKDHAQQKFAVMTAYMFELGYDLALSPLCNVSKSPGFEGCGLRRPEA